MQHDPGIPRTARASLASFVVLTLLALPAAPTSAATDETCRVRNVETGAAYPALQAAVDAASPGDRLVVKGLCRGGSSIDKDLVIQGVRTVRWGRPVLDGERRTRVLKIARVATVTLRGLIIRGGHINHGAGIMNRGALTISGGSIRDNRAEESGGGIANWRHASLTLRKVLLRGNSAFGYGGALLSNGRATIGDSRFLANRAISGGAIVNGDRMVLRRSLVRANTASGNGVGGGIYTDHSLTLIDTRVTGNRADLEGGGIWNWPETGTVRLDTRSSVTANEPDDCWGTPAC